MCSMLRIPVCMHNVDENDIYRPSAWGAFGMDKEGQDYRACAAYGPLYKHIRKSFKRNAYFPLRMTVGEVCVF